MEKYIWYSKTRGAKGSYIVRPWHSDISYVSLGFSLTSPINRSITSVLISLTALSLVISFYYYTPLPWYPSKHSILSNVIPRTLYSEHYTLNIILRILYFELPLASNFLLLRTSSCFELPPTSILLLPSSFFKHHPSVRSSITLIILLLPLPLYLQYHLSLYGSLPYNCPRKPTRYRAFN
jgi:hypothetical protein